MPIWRGSTITPANDPQIHVKYSSLTLDANRKTQVGEAVQRARYMLAWVLANMQSPAALSDVGKMGLHCYFMTPANGPTQGDFDTIKSVLELTQAGLTSVGGVAVKISSGSPGYVNVHVRGTSSLRAKLLGAPLATTMFAKSGWTPGTKKDFGDVHRGSIHVSTGRLDTGTRLAAKTVIHEATHKFASTADFGEKGYTYDATGEYRTPNGETPLTAAEALNNAESYARFVLEWFDAEVGWA
ncbi:MAG: hypothetical protein ACKVQT_09560 [Burkholderiales bacterium]